MYYSLNNTMPIILISSIVVILLVHPNSSINAQTTPIKKPIRIGLPLWVPDLLTYVAQEKGFFKKNNVDVNLTTMQHTDDVANKYADGDFDGILTVYPDVIILQSSGVNTKVVYTIDSSFKGDAIVGHGHNLSDEKEKR